MRYYSQHTPGYEKIKLGTCADSLWQSACFLTSFCNLGKEQEWFDIHPVSMNKLFIQNKLFANGCGLVAGAVAKHFGLTYERLSKDPGVICIAETNKYAAIGVPQHFFVYEKGMILDPLDPPEKIQWKKNTYPVVSYRVFKRPVAPKPVEVPVIQPPQPVEQPPVTETAPTMQEMTQDEQKPISETNIQVETPQVDEKVQETGTVEPKSRFWASLFGLIAKLLKIKS